MNPQNVSRNQQTATPMPILDKQIAMADPGNFVTYYNDALASALLRAKCSVRLYTSEFSYTQRNPRPFEESFYFRRWKYLQANSFSYTRKIIRILQYPVDHVRLLMRMHTLGSTILHLQWSRIPLFDLLLVWAAKALGLRTVMTVHDVTPLYRFAGGRKLMGFLLRSVDRLIVHSQWAKTELLRNQPKLISDKIHIVPHGILGGAVNSAESGVSRSVARKYFAIPEHHLVVLFFGSMKPFKGLPFFGEVMKACQDRDLPITFILAGKPSSREMGALLAKMVCDLTNTVANFFYVPDGDEPRYFAAADLVALPYDEISQSGVMSTAMGYGKAVFATPVGNFPEVIVDKVTGRLLRQDVDLWVGELASLAQNQSMCSRMGELARARGLTEYNWDIAAAKTIKIYSDIGE